MFKVTTLHLQNTVINGLIRKSWAVMFEIHFWRTFLCVCVSICVDVCVCEGVILTTPFSQHVVIFLLSDDYSDGFASAFTVCERMNLLVSLCVSLLYVCGYGFVCMLY